jgi:hypothetical protein
MTVLTQLTSSIDTNHEFDAGSNLSFHNFDVNLNNAARSGGYSPGASFVEWTMVGSFDMRFDCCWGGTRVTG